MAAAKEGTAGLQDRTFRPEQFLDQDNAPEFSHRLAVAHFMKTHEQLELEALLQEIHQAERNTRRNELLLAKGRQYLQAFEAKKDVCHLKEYLKWLREQDEAQQKAKAVAVVERERARKQRMQTIPQEVADEKAAEANKVKVDLERAFRVRNTLREEELQHRRAQIREMKEQAAFNRVQLRNQHAKDAQQRNVVVVRERQEADRALAHSRQPPDRPPPSPPCRMRSASVACRSLQTLQSPPSASTMEPPSQKEELERLMEEMEQAQAHLRESRREFEMAAQRTVNVNLCLSGLRRSSPTRSSRGAHFGMHLAR
eukprot:GGOE01061644.1.p1 GENE.GGOE01061644.1~~GGOE01061644.1.p1  ORF type:complete len:313 (+),score=102.69 GGOE01061644.1:94-1032(+)